MKDFLKSLLEKESAEQKFDRMMQEALKRNDIVLLREDSDETKEGRSK